MNVTSRTRGIIAASLVFVGFAASVSYAQTVNVNGATCASATVTLGAGTININTAGCAGTVASPPSISGLSATSGFRNDPVTINGANLTGASVTIGGVTANVASNSGSQIITSVPATATLGAGNVAVTTSVAPAASVAFTVNAPPTVPPTIASLSVTSGTPGTALTITGANLSGASVTIGGAAASVTSNNGSQIVTTVPQAATVGAGTVTVTTTVTPPASAGFTVVALPAPTISSVSPATGAPGTVVTISGSAFTGVTSVTIGGASASITTSSATSITTTVPGAAALGAGNVVVTTAVAPAASSPFTVTVVTGVDMSIEGITVPNPSKLAFIIPPFHAGLNGAGSEVNAYAMPPTRCLTTPTLTRSWQHNIDLADYKGKNAFDFFVMSSGESLSYKFTVGSADASGGFIYNDAANAVVRPTFISITTNPCDFDTSKLVIGASRDSCYQTGLNGNSVNWANITGPLPAAYCRLIKGNTYYMNIRFQDGRPASLGGSPTTDSCTSGNCGVIIQVL